MLAALGANDWRIAATARQLGVSRTTLYALIDASPHVRKAKDVPVEEIRRCHEECGGDLQAMAAQLRVSRRGLRLRMGPIGPADAGS